MTYKSQSGGNDGCATLARRAKVASDKRRLRGPVPLHFENFYRANLRFVVGARLRTMEVARLYQGWAEANAESSLNLKQLKRAMLNIGHRAYHSHGMYYQDVGFARSYPDLLDNYPAVPVASEAHAASLVSRLDAMITELSALRGDVMHAGENSETRKVG